MTFNRNHHITNHKYCLYILISDIKSRSCKAVHKKRNETSQLSAISNYLIKLESCLIIWLALVYSHACTHPCSGILRAVREHSTSVCWGTSGLAASVVLVAAGNVRVPTRSAIFRPWEQQRGRPGRGSAHGSGHRTGTDPGRRAFSAARTASDGHWTAAGGSLRGCMLESWRSTDLRPPIRAPTPCASPSAVRCRPIVNSSWFFSLRSSVKRTVKCASSHDQTKMVWSV